jgi:hypothetical protein
MPAIPEDTLMNWYRKFAATQQMTPEEAYQILGLPFGASSEQIKKNYRQLVHKYHPDVNKNDGTMIRRINEANDVADNWARQNAVPATPANTPSQIDTSTLSDLEKRRLVALVPHLPQHFDLNKFTTKEIMIKQLSSYAKLLRLDLNTMTPAHWEFLWQLILVKMVQHI